MFVISVQTSISFQSIGLICSVVPCVHAIFRFFSSFSLRSVLNVALMSGAILLCATKAIFLFLLFTIRVEERRFDGVACDFGARRVHFNNPYNRNNNNCILTSWFLTGSICMVDGVKSKRGERKKKTAREKRKIPVKRSIGRSRLAMNHYHNNRNTINNTQRYGYEQCTTIRKKDVLTYVNVYGTSRWRTRVIQYDRSW